MYELYKPVKELCNDSDGITAYLIPICFNNLKK